MNRTAKILIPCISILIALSILLSSALFLNIDLKKGQKKASNLDNPLFYSQSLPSLPENPDEFIEAIPPNNPVVPDDPVVPDEPVVPDVPEIPDEPDVPDVPDVPEIPDEPKDPYAEDDDSGIKNSDIVRVKDHIPSIFVDLRYSGKNNVLGEPIYSYSDAYLRYGTVRKLRDAQEELLKQGFSLKIWDAYRPLDAQNDLSLLLPSYGTSPTEGYTAFNYGNTVSITIVKANGSAVSMPSDFDASGNTADRYFGDVSSAARKYANLLDSTLKKYGFNQYLQKWYRYRDSASYPLTHTLSIDENGLCTVSEKWKVKHSSSVTIWSVGTNKKAIAYAANGSTPNVLFFNKRFAYVEHKGYYGLIYANYLVHVNTNFYRDDLKFVQVKDKYSYSDMQRDIALLKENYPDIITVSSIGKSEEGRDLTLMLIGNKNAKINILVQASIHAREHITTPLLMAQIDYMLKILDSEYEDSGYSCRDLLERVCLHVIPMVNPDGVTISQTGIISPLYTGNKKGVDTKAWKANAKGIDLNSNFAADWEDYSSNITSPAPEKYKGTYPECATESKALANYLRNNYIDVTVSYHTMGSIIYWDYPNQNKVNKINRDLCASLVDKLGFFLMSDPTTCAGFRDWAILQGIPSLTLEFGAGGAPSNFNEFDQMWARGRDVIFDTLIWALENEASLPNYGRVIEPEPEPEPDKGEDQIQRE